jgi:hypothetical protein
MTGNGVKPQKTREQIENELREEIRDAQLELSKAPSEAARNRLAEALRVFNNVILQSDPWGNSEIARLLLHRPTDSTLRPCPSIRRH